MPASPAGLHAVADFYSVLHDQSLTATADGSSGVYGVVHNDSTTRGTSIVVSEVNGSPANVGQPVTLTSGASITLYADGSFAYVALPRSAYADTFDYTAFDGVVSQSTKVTIAVTNVAPTIDSVTLSNTSPQTNDVLTATVNNPADADGDSITYQYVWKVNGTTVQTTPTTSTTDTLDLSQPGFGENGDAISVSVTPMDVIAAGSAVSASATVVNTAPTASDASLSVIHDQPLTIDLNQFAYDADGDPLTFSISGPSNGQLALNQDGTYTYTPNAGWTGDDSFGFTASDGIGTSSAATVTISVTNQAPVAVAEDFTLHAGLLLSLDSTNGLLHDAYDPDGDHLVVQLVDAAPAYGTLNLNADGSFTYLANQGFVGDDTFNYRLFDGAAYSATMAVTIHVQDQAPIASASSFDVWAAQGITTGTANVLANATDPENDALTAVLVSLPTYAAPNSFQLNGDGTFSYQLMADAPSTFNGQDSFQIMAFDGTINSVPVTVTLNVTNSPMAKNDSYVLGSSGQVYVSAATGVLANDFNPMQAVLGAELVQGVDANVGALNFNQDGSFLFTAGVNFQDQASFSYRTLIQVGNVFFPGTTAVVRIATSGLIASTSSLFSVGFNTNATIAADDGVVQNGPQWRVAIAPNGGIPAQPARQNPLSFTRNTTIGLTPTFQIDPNMVLFWQSCGNNILVHADSNVVLDNGNPLQLGYSQNIHLQMTNDAKELTTQGFVLMDSLLPNYTDYYASLDLAWQISPDGGLTWASVGTSTDQTFVTLANPNGWNSATVNVGAFAQMNGWTSSPLAALTGLWVALAKPTIPLTVFYVSIEGGNGNGATNDATLVADIWSGFTTRRITRADGTPMTYYESWSTLVFATNALIK